MSRLAYPTRPFDGHGRQHGLERDAELTSVGPGTPGGEYLRRFWQPVALSSQVTDLPLAVRMLGEDLVIFRTAGGDVGLLEAHCSHRGASLEYGLVSEEGIRCCYHGWHFACDGRILETPNDPTSRIRERLFHPAYPTREFRGIVFAYMGDPDTVPPFPHLDTFDEPGTELIPFSLHYPCNWLQCSENTQDPVHSVFLHTRISGAQFAESWGEMPSVEYVETPLGMMNINVRRWRDNIWVRTTETILPNLNQAGALWETADDEKCFLRVSLTRWMRPADDENTLIIGWRHFNDRVDPDHKGIREEVGLERIDFLGQTEGRTQEERQRIPGDFEAIVSQRPVAIHALENLTGSDAGVALMRRLLRRQIRALAEGATPASPLLAETRPVPTYTQDTIMEIPRSGNEEAAERELMRRMGREVAEAILSSAAEEVATRRQSFAEAVTAIRDAARSGR